MGGDGERSDDTQWIKDPLAIFADGEYLCQTPAEISAAPRALRVIVP